MNAKPVATADVFGKPDKETGEVKTISKVGGRLLAVVLRERKDCLLQIVDKNKDTFTVAGHLYFVDASGCYINQTLVVSVYMEGVPVPLCHKYLEKEDVERSFEDSRGVMQKVKITIIKSLKFDSALLEFLLNRKLSDNFTRMHLDMPNLLLLLLLIGALITGIINVGLHFF